MFNVRFRDQKPTNFGIRRGRTIPMQAGCCKLTINYNNSQPQVSQFKLTMGRRLRNHNIAPNNKFA